MHGRPDETSGLWAAVVLADAHLVRAGCDTPRAAQLAQSLASALLGRDAQPSEFYGHRAGQSGRDTDALLSELLEAYEQLLDTHAERQNDPNPGPGNAEYRAWRARHRALPYLLARDGCEETARGVAKGIPESLWAAMEATPV